MTSNGSAPHFGVHPQHTQKPPCTAPNINVGIEPMIDVRDGSRTVVVMDDTNTELRLPQEAGAETASAPGHHAVIHDGNGTWFSVAGL